MVEERQVSYVNRECARRTFFVDDDRDRTTFRTLAECQPAATRETSVRKPLQHDRIILQQRLDLLFELLLRGDPGVLATDPAVAADHERLGDAEEWTVRQFDILAV